MLGALALCVLAGCAAGAGAGTITGTATPSPAMPPSAPPTQTSSPTPKPVSAEQVVAVANHFWFGQGPNPCRVFDCPINTAARRPPGRTHQDPKRLQNGHGGFVVPLPERFRSGHYGRGDLRRRDRSRDLGHAPQAGLPHGGAGRQTPGRRHAVHQARADYLDLRARRPGSVRAPHVVI